MAAREALACWRVDVFVDDETGDMCASVHAQDLETGQWAWVCSTSEYVVELDLLEELHRLLVRHGVLEYP